MAPPASELFGRFAVEVFSIALGIGAALVNDTIAMIGWGVEGIKFERHSASVDDVVIDPGFGFAKTIEQNYRLLNKLSYFKELNVPILAGVSRKSMIYNLLKTDAEGALNGTTAINILALTGGSNILRVHDVKEAMQAITIYKQYCEGSLIES